GVRLRRQPRIGAIELELLAVERGEARRENGRLARLEGSVDGPVLHRNEGLDLSLSFHDDPQSHRLDTPRGESAPDLFPQEVRDFVAHQTVDDAAGLLRVDEPAVDLSGLLDRGKHRLLGDLVEADALENGSLGGGLLSLLEVPGDRFAFPIGVSGEIDRVGALGGAGELGQRLLFAREDLVGWLIGMAAVDTQTLLG